MSEGMVERGARVICGANCLRAKVLDEPCIGERGRNAPCRASVAQLVLVGHWETAEKFIAAMREPTEAMIEAGSVYIYEGPNDSRHCAEDAWGAMTDAAIKEPVT